VHGSEDLHTHTEEKNLLVHGLLSACARGPVCMTKVASDVCSCRLYLAERHQIHSLKGHKITQTKPFVAPKGDAPTRHVSSARRKKKQATEVKLAKEFHLCLKQHQSRTASSSSLGCKSNRSDSGGHRRHRTSAVSITLLATCQHWHTPKAVNLLPQRRRKTQL